MVLGKAKYKNVMGVVSYIHCMCNDGWTIVVHFEGTYRKDIEFDTEEACKQAFETIWDDLSRRGYCDLDRFNKKTGMVMR